MDRRLAWLVLLFGALLVGGAILAFARGSVAEVVPAGTLGLGLVATGGMALRGKRAVLGAAISLTFLTAALMAVRLHQTERLLPSLPVGLLAFCLCAALVGERRRRAPPAPKR